LDPELHGSGSRSLKTGGESIKRLTRTENDKEIQKEEEKRKRRSREREKRAEGD
jgi:hypothetical protein